MRIKASTQRKLRYGSVSVALTALIIAAVIIVNVILTLCVQKFTWYIDLTPEPHFTISDACFDLIGKEDASDGTDTPVEKIKAIREKNKAQNAENGLTEGAEGYLDENIRINILFGLDRDVLLSNANAEYVVRIAEELAAKFPDYITVEYASQLLKPTRFRKYQASNTDKIDTDSVIIEYGSQYRIRSLKSFFVFENDTAVGYNAEKAYASSILAITGAEVPLVCYTVNHGETFPDEVRDENNMIVSAPFLDVIAEAGYRAQPIDLEKEEIPADCRILLIFNPQQDFIAYKNGVTQSSELDKLDTFLLEDRNSVMTFMAPNARQGEQGLENLEDFLAEWGLSFRRDGAEPYIVRDNSNNVGGVSDIVADYSLNPLAQGWCEPLLSGGGSAPKVIFPHAAALTYSSRYSMAQVTHQDDNDKTVGPYQIGRESSTPYRKVYDIFYSKSEATAWAGDREVAQAKNENGTVDAFKLMSVSTKTESESEANGALSDSSYVLLCGSVDFAAAEYLSANSKFGNRDLLLSALEMMGREPVPVGLNYVEFANYDIQTITEKESTQYTLVLTLVPVTAALICGIVVIVRRKNR